MQKRESGKGRREGRLGEKEQRQAEEGASESEKALSWDPPARDFLPVMCTPPSVFILPQRFPGSLRIPCRYRREEATFTDPLRHVPVLPRAHWLLQLGTSLTLETGDDEEGGEGDVEGQEKTGRWGSAKGASLAEAMQREYDANAT